MSSLPPICFDGCLALSSTGSAPSRWRLASPHCHDCSSYFRASISAIRARSTVCEASIVSP